MLTCYDKDSTDYFNHQSGNWSRQSKIFYQISTSGQSPKMYVKQSILSKIVAYTVHCC